MPQLLLNWDIAVTAVGSVTGAAVVLLSWISWKEKPRPLVLEVAPFYCLSAASNICLLLTPALLYGIPLSSDGLRAACWSSVTVAYHMVMEQLFRLRFVSAVKSDYGYIIVTMLAVALFVVSLFLSIVPQFTLALGLAIQQWSTAIFFVIISKRLACSSKSESSHSAGSSVSESSPSQVPPRTPPSQDLPETSNSPSSKAKARRRLLFMGCLYAALGLIAVIFSIFTLLDPNSQPNSAVSMAMMLLSYVGMFAPAARLALKHLRGRLSHREVGYEKGTSELALTEMDPEARGDGDSEAPSEGETEQGTSKAELIRCPKEVWDKLRNNQYHRDMYLEALGLKTQCPRDSTVESLADGVNSLQQPEPTFFKV